MLPSAAIAGTGRVEVEKGEVIVREDIEIVRNALQEEQRWLAAIQARDPRRKDPKLTALEEALAALDRIEGNLRKLGAVVDPPRQMKLL